MTQASKPPLPQGVALPRLSDDAAAEIYLFLEQLLNLFEARYGDQVHRFYEDLSRHNLIEPDIDRQLDDPPF